MIEKIQTTHAQPTFKANIDNKFLDAADAYYKKAKYSGGYKQFCSAVRRFAEIPNSDNLTIRYKKKFNDDKISHILYATETGSDKEIILSEKDLFRKLLQKFSFMNEYEFKVKTGLKK